MEKEKFKIKEIYRHRFDGEVEFNSKRVKDARLSGFDDIIWSELPDEVLLNLNDDYYIDSLTISDFRNKDSKGSTVSTRVLVKESESDKTSEEVFDDYEFKDRLIPVRDPSGKIKEVYVLLDYLSEAPSSDV